MQIKTQGIVIKQRNIGENDRIITILSRDLGIIEATARGSKSIRSAIGAAVQIFSYGDFCLFKGKSNYIVNSAETIESFYQLRLDVVKLSLAGYFCELLNYLSKTADEHSEVYLKLILNTLHFLQEEKRNQTLLKSIFEMRALSIAGFMPNLICCSECAAYEKEKMFFFLLEGTLVCDDCIAVSGYNTERAIQIPVSMAVLSAMRHIIFSEFEKLFSFNLSGLSLEQLNYVTEHYMLLHTEAKFNSLEMYHAIADTL